jgi:hypothetical protein
MPQLLRDLLWKTRRRSAPREIPARNPHKIWAQSLFLFSFMTFDTVTGTVSLPLAA